MGDITEVTGMILSSMPVGEFDRRVVLLTKGARKPNSPLVGITRAFVFGTFQVYEGRTSYTIRQASITHYFEAVISDLDAVCYACYFAEIADYYGRENLDAADMLNLLYVSLKALANKKITDTLVYVFDDGGRHLLPCVSRTGAGRHTVRRIYRIHAPVYCHGTA